MERDEALTLLKGGRAGIQEWNARTSVEHGRDFIRFDLEQVDLSGADLSGVNLHHARLVKANLSNTDLTFANLEDANLSSARLTNADLRGVDLREANLLYADLSGANLSKANLTGAVLIRARLTSADLSGANLLGANLSEARLNNADLRGVDLTHAALRGASPTNADLAHARLIFADLRTGVVKGLRLDAADLSDVAVVSNADLVTDTEWSELKIYDRVYRRDRLHVDPLPFGMGPCLTFSIRFGALSEAQLKQLCGIADYMMAGGTLAMSVHQGGEDRLEARTYGPDKEDRFVEVFRSVTEQLRTLVHEVRGLRVDGLTKADLQALVPRLLSTLAVTEAEQNKRLLQEMGDSAERKALALARDSALGTLKKFLSGLGS